MIETLALVGLIALGSVAVGVLLGRYYVPDDRALKRSADHGRAYLRAINHLVARNRDAAIDELRDVVEDDVAELDPYFALAALFRSRGEWERAIRVHQAIELRAADDDAIRTRALYELGLDFRSAGMPRRATKAMEECVREDSRHGGALRALTGLYEEQGRYAEAAEAWQRLAKLDGHGSPREIHLLAAAAERALGRDRMDLAREYSKSALRLSESDPHALVAAAALARAGGDSRESRDLLLRAVRSKPDLISFVLPALLASCESGSGGETEQQRVFAALQNLVSEVGDPLPLELAMVEMQLSYAPDAARFRIEKVANEHKGYLPIQARAGQLALQSGDASGSALERLVGDGGALEWVLRGAWKCSSCSRVQDRFYWRCPSCRHWGTADLDTAERRDLGGVRERRQFSRAPTGAVLVAGDDGLPVSTIPRPGSDSDGEVGAVGRAKGWIADTFGSLRRK